MTAEIAILNRGAVALAADSAVTVGDESGSKVYNTVNKLFTLSKYQPVGIMIYGGAEYMTIPWETVIKLYREQLGTRSFRTVQLYARDFLRYLDREFTIDAADQNTRVHQIWVAYFQDMSKRLRRALLRDAANQTLTQTDVNKRFLALVREDIAALRGLPTLRQYRSQSMASVQRRFRGALSEITKHCFRGRRISPAVNRVLREYAFLVLVKQDFRLSVTGIVVAGFGTDEIFPSMYRARLAGKFFGHIKIQAQDYIEVDSTENNSVYIQPFAQGEMVHRFMEGIDEAYSVYIRDGATQLVERLANDLVMKYSGGTSQLKLRRAAAAKRTAQKMIAEFERTAVVFRYHIFVKPVLDIVSILPKEELAELAGALVSITSLKRKISMDTETVGGPIDVAVISKGDGFIWIRRKHYFRPELNTAFLQNYLSSSRP